MNAFGGSVSMIWALVVTVSLGSVTGVLILHARWLRLLAECVERLEALAFEITRLNQAFSGVEVKSVGTGGPGTGGNTNSAMTTGSRSSTLAFEPVEGSAQPIGFVSWRNLDGTMRSPAEVQVMIEEARATSAGRH